MGREAPRSVHKVGSVPVLAVVENLAERLSHSLRKTHLKPKVGLVHVGANDWLQILAFAHNAA